MGEGGKGLKGLGRVRKPNSYRGLRPLDPTHPLDPIPCCTRASHEHYYWRESPHTFQSFFRILHFDPCCPKKVGSYSDSDPKLAKNGVNSRFDSNSGVGIAHLCFFQHRNTSSVKNNQKHYFNFCHGPNPRDMTSSPGQCLDSDFSRQKS